MLKELEVPYWNLKSPFLKTKNVLYYIIEEKTMRKPLLNSKLKNRNAHLLTTLFCAISLLTFPAYADETEMSSEMAAEESVSAEEETMTETASETLPAESENVDQSETSDEMIGETETIPETTAPSDPYCHIKIVTEFADDVDTESFTGYKVILTPIGLEQFYDDGIIPEDYQIPNESYMVDESYEMYELNMSEITDYAAEIDIQGTRVLNIEFTEPNILAQDNYTYTPYGDCIDIDFKDLDMSGYLVGEAHLMKNEPGVNKTIHVIVSHNPNPVKPNINEVEVSDDDKRITNQAMNGPSNEIEIKHTVIDEIAYTNEEKFMRFLPVLIGGIVVIGAGVAGFIYIKKRRNGDFEEDD